MGTKKTLINQLKKFRLRANTDMTIERLILFGSNATGKTHRWSDVDLIVVSRIFNTMNFFERGACMYNYWNIKKPVDFICYTPKEFKKLSKQVSIVNEALKEGIEI